MSDHAIDVVLHRARLLKLDCAELERALSKVEGWPAYRTRAEAMLEDAQTAMRHTMKAIEDGLPVERNMETDNVVQAS